MYDGQTVHSDICLLYKGRMVFHLIKHDIDKNKSACILLQNTKLCCGKTAYYKLL